jgi:excisionase family DNA binding protein
MTKRTLQSQLRFVSSREACAVLGVTAATMRRWAKAGKIGAIRTPGNQWRYDLSGLIVASTPEPVAPTPKIRKRARAPHSAVQPVASPVATSAAPEAPKPQAAILEAFAAMIDPKVAAEVVAAAPRMSPEALRAQIERLSQSSAW